MKVTDPPTPWLALPQWCPAGLCQSGRHLNRIPDEHSNHHACSQDFGDRFGRQCEDIVRNNVPDQIKADDTCRAWRPLWATSNERNHYRHQHHRRRQEPINWLTGTSFHPAPALQRAAAPQPAPADMLVAQRSTLYEYISRTYGRVPCPHFWSVTRDLRHMTPLVTHTRAGAGFTIRRGDALEELNGIQLSVGQPMAIRT